MNRLRLPGTIAAALGFAALVHAAELHVAPDGDDAAPGTAARPLRTIRRAAGRLAPGDDCVIHEGTYRETIRPAVSGVAGAPIRFRAAAGARVLIRGTDPVTAWTLHTGRIYRAAVTWPVDQLFSDGRLMPPASTPDGGADPFDVKYIHVQMGRTNVSGGAALKQPVNAWAGGAIRGTSRRLGWVCGGARILASEPGRLTIDRQIPWWRNEPGRAVLFGTAAALDAAREWYQRDGTLYFRPPGDAGPETLGVEVTHRRWAFDLSERGHIHVIGLHLHAAGINLEHAHDCVLDGLRVRYASFQQFYRGAFNRDLPVHADSEGVGIALGGRRNVIRNTVVSRCTGDGISVWGTSNTVRNCVVYDCNTSASDCAPITCTGLGHVLQSNTVFNAGRSIVLHRHLAGGRILHNHLYNAGRLCNDLGITYAYRTDGRGTEIAYNHMHHYVSPMPGGVGIYLDDGSKGHIVHHNLVYAVPSALAMNPPKSRNNLVFNNTLIGGHAGIAMGSRRQDLSGTRIFNNLFRPHISRTVLDSRVVFLAHNITRAAADHFVDPGRGDYTLRAGSPAVDAGMVFAPYTDGFTGAAPDLGAFERGLPPWTAGASIPESRWGCLDPW